MTLAAQSVALCLLGVPRAFHKTAPNLERNLLEVLHADLFIYVAVNKRSWSRRTWQDADAAQSAAVVAAGIRLREGAEALEWLCGRGNVVGAPGRGGQPMRTTGLERSAAWAALCQFLQSHEVSLRAADDSVLAAMPAAAWGAAANHEGEWLHNSSLVLQYFAHWQRPAAVS
eukprot:TRINITY_DN50236_c0_g1_i1.p3 TRINITY_DN50236_c0_g1~~TRINITY_DN50236_c0_g1_i1.p3  ORF type:complete len:172 (+),score=34.52 TRINITY_DN50236_c0_g1_i1:74-589(+)